MAYVRQRTTKAGVLSTALVESYRDAQGRPRQRLIVNLHGESDVLTALAKVYVRYEQLAEEYKELVAEYERAGAKTKWRLADRILANERKLDAFQKDGAILEKHCTATPDEIEDAIQAHIQEFMAAFHEVVGRGWAYRQQLKTAKAKLRRLRS